MRLDLSLFERINGLAGHYRLVDDLFVDLARFGPYLLAAAFVVFWLWPAPARVRAQRLLGGILAVLAALLALGANQLLGRLWYRPRPFVGHSARLLLPGSHDPSFPSDHAAFAFAVAVMVLMVSRRLGLAALLLAALAAFARVYVGEHYPADVLAGALVGGVAALLVWRVRDYVAVVFRPVFWIARRVHLA